MSIHMRFGRVMKTVGNSFHEIDLEIDPGATYSIAQSSVTYPKSQNSVHLTLRITLYTSEKKLHGEKHRPRSGWNVHIGSEKSKNLGFTFSFCICTLLVQVSGEDRFLRARPPVP